LSKIISIGTAVPSYRHSQEDILHFMQRVYAMNETEKRKLKFLYHQSGIDTRYSVIPDYSRNAGEWVFCPNEENLEPFPSLELRMKWFNKYAGPLSVNAITNCLGNHAQPKDITHLITVSCTGMSAPGLDLQVMELMELPSNIYRTSVNFMGCYAFIHAMKLADAICKTDTAAKVMVVCTELCTLHFQKEPTADNVASGLLFSDGAAAALITHDSNSNHGWTIDSFYAEVVAKGKKDMSWQLSGNGFLMTLSGYVPDLVEADFAPLVTNALQHAGITVDAIDHWCIHPGGKRILSAIEKALQTVPGALQDCYDVLKEFGNMSSATILFVLQQIMHNNAGNDHGKLFGAAFGPGLTMETFVLTKQ
jgi:predicted naringenin-chalcone synthase